MKNSCLNSRVALKTFFILVCITYVSCSGRQNHISTNGRLSKALYQDDNVVHWHDNGLERLKIPKYLDGSCNTNEPCQLEYKTYTSHITRYRHIDLLIGVLKEFGEHPLLLLEKRKSEDDVKTEAIRFIWGSNCETTMVIRLERIKKEHWVAVKKKGDPFDCTSLDKKGKRYFAIKKIGSLEWNMVMQVLKKYHYFDLPTYIEHDNVILDCSSFIIGEAYIDGKYSFTLEECVEVGDLRNSILLTLSILGVNLPEYFVNNNFPKEGNMGTSK